MKFAAMTWDAGRVSRPTTKGYRRPNGFAINVVFKPSKSVGTVRVIKKESK